VKPDIDPWVDDEKNKKNDSKMYTGITIGAILFLPLIFIVGPILAITVFLVCCAVAAAMTEEG